MKSETDDESYLDRGGKGKAKDPKAQLFFEADPWHNYCQQRSDSSLGFKVSEVDVLKSQIR